VLKKQASPRGDTGDWPLDDERVRQFLDAAKARKMIVAAAGLYRALLALCAIAFAIFLLIGGFAAASSGARRPTVLALGLLPAAGVMLGLTVLYFFTSAATLRAQRWAPLTMLILYSVSGLLQLFQLFTMSTSGNRMVVGALPAAVFGLFLSVVFAAVSWRAYAAIPKYLAQPAWCQELLVSSFSWR
jgi:hypothetical protein